MTDVWTRPLLRRDDLTPGSLAPWLAAALAAAWSLVAGLALAGLPALAVWMGEGATAPVGDPLGIGAAVWLAAHRVPLDVDGATFQLAPGGLSLLLVLLTYRAARWASHAGGAGTPSHVAQVIAVVTASYAAGAGAVAAVSATERVQATPLSAGMWTAAVALVAASAGAARQAGLVRPLLSRVPAWIRASLMAGAVSAAGLVIVGAVLVGASAATGADRVGALAVALDPDLAGGIALTLASAAIVPNAVVWAAAFALGPGFAVGAGTSVAPAGVELGLVPAFPALGALPQDDLGLYGWAFLAGPVLAGCAAGVVLHRRSDGNAVWLLAGQAAVAAAFAAAVMAALAVLSGGSVGQARLAELGPDPVPVALATLVLTVVPALAVAATAGRLRPRAATA